MARIAQYAPVYISSLQKRPFFSVKENRKREYPKATYMHWQKLLSLFEPKSMPSFFDRQKQKRLNTF